MEKTKPFLSLDKDSPFYLVFDLLYNADCRELSEFCIDDVLNPRIYYFGFVLDDLVIVQHARYYDFYHLDDVVII